MDLFGPLPETSNHERWILVIEDTATRWVKLLPLKIASAEAFASLINDVILRYGIPRRVITDNAPNLPVMW